MEKLFLSLTAFFLIGIFTPRLYAQQKEYYCIFKVEGKPLLDDTEVLEKGMFVKPENFLTLSENDQVVLMDQNGEMYEIRKKAIIPFARIKRYTQKNKQNFTVKYLKYVWKKLWEREEKENIGVVFRSPRLSQLIAPSDSVVLRGPMVRFEWIKKEKDSLSYFFLIDDKSKKMTQINLYADKITLPTQEGLLNYNTKYNWAVANSYDDKHQDLQFNSFTIIDDEEFSNRLSEYKEIINEFVALGFTEAEILSTLCEDLKLCSN